VITNAEVKNRLFAIGIDAVGNTPDELAQIMKIETAKWSQVIREAGIQPH
jgi:tripartite-type tricarboxylate transporter receptor subunit TctC